MKQIIKPLILLSVLLSIIIACIWFGCWLNHADVQEWIKEAGFNTCVLVGVLSSLGFIGTVVVTSADSF